MEIPDGWTMTKTMYGHDTWVIERPLKIGGGMVSIDFGRRNFAGGLGTTYRPDSTKKYSGRGWREALIADAVEWLDEAMGANVR